MKRYVKNKDIVMQGMIKLGFKPYLTPEYAGPIITSFHYPNSKNWNFETFYQKLADKKFVKIYIFFFLLFFFLIYNIFIH